MDIDHGQWREIMVNGERSWSMERDHDQCERSWSTERDHDQCERSWSMERDHDQ